MNAKRRRPANFEVREYSSAFLDDVTWRIEVSANGVSARRDKDGATCSIDWRRLIGAAMFYGGTYAPITGQRTTIER